MRPMRTMREAIVGGFPNMDTTPGEMVVFTPGNMTSYEVYFQKLSSMISEPLGFGVGATLIVFCNMKNRPSIILPKETGYLSLTYFMDKTGLEVGDAEPLVALISHQLRLDNLKVGKKNEQDC